ncbi:MAG: nitroreductase family protein [Dehalococcoidales bacterium]
MEFAEVIKKRYSVRSYKPIPVEEEKLEIILEAARIAPTACNRQPFLFIVFEPQGKEEELKRVYHGLWLSEAPVIICACAIPSESWVRRDGTNYSFIDLAIAVDHLILAAADLGLGTCWVGAFDVSAVREMLKLPAHIEPLVLIPIGYPNDSAPTKHRKPIEEIVRYNHY